MVTAMDYIINGDESFRKQINGCLVGFAGMLDQYRQHVLGTEEDRRQSSEEFLKRDFLLEMMINDFGCYQSALNVMKTYAAEATPA